MATQRPHTLKSVGDREPSTPQD